MLDIKKVGLKICAFRKKAGYSQEKLADLLRISPQAISKWENGHSVPDILLLPVLAQIFDCTIDEIVMPAYSFDEQIEIEKTTPIEKQAEHIAQIIIKKIGETNMKNTNKGLDDQEIIDAVRKIHPDLNNLEITKNTTDKKKIFITVKTPQTELKLVEEIGNDHKVRWYDIFSPHTSVVPTAYFISAERKVLLTEDLSENYIHGDYYNDDNENGKFIRENYKPILKAVAAFHSDFWEDAGVFEKIGLDWRLQTKENMLAYISGLEKDFKKYKKNEEAGKFSKGGDTFSNNFDDYKNNIEKYQLDYFQKAIEYLKEEYTKLIDSRFDTGKNITVVGKLHPGNTFVPKSSGKPAKIDSYASPCNPSDRIGLCTEDLAMLVALHMSSEWIWDNEICSDTILAADTISYKKYTESLLKYYYECLSEKVKDYSYEAFINDYKISIAERMFHSIGVINHGINDFAMRDKAIKSFEAFVLEK